MALTVVRVRLVLRELAGRGRFPKAHRLCCRLSGRSDFARPIWSQAEPLIRDAAMFPVLLLAEDAINTGERRITEMSLDIDEIDFHQVAGDPMTFAPYLPILGVGDAWNRSYWNPATDGVGLQFFRAERSKKLRRDP